MMRGLIIVVLTTLCVTGAEKKRKPPDVEVLEATGRRSEGSVAIEGRVRNTGEKPIKGMILLFDFMASGRAVITTQKIALDDEILEQGKESVFRVQTNDPVRAVEFQINAVDGSGRDLRVAKAGPFAIE
jgi:hypothetical protein